MTRMAKRYCRVLRRRAEWLRHGVAAGLGSPGALGWMAAEAEALEFALAMIERVEGRA